MINNDIGSSKEELHSLNTPVSRLLFAALLDKNRPARDDNFFRVAGLTSLFEPGSANFETPLGISRTSAPEVLDLKSLFHHGTDRFDLKVVNSPNMDLHTTSHEAKVSTERIEKLGLEIRNWWDCLEAEVIMTHLAAMRGDNDRYQILTDLQNPFSLKKIGKTPDQIDFLKNLPAGLAQYVRTDNLVKPHPRRHVASWQSKDQMFSDAAISYDVTTAFADVHKGQGLLELFKDLYDYMRQGNNKRDDFYCKSAMIEIKEEQNEGKNFSEDECYVMLVSPEIGEIIKQDSKWQSCQEGHTSNPRYQQLISRGYIGLCCNIWVLEHPKVPRFTVDLKGKSARFTRAVILGKEAVAAGYSDNEIPVKYKNAKTDKQGKVTIKTPFMTHFSDPAYGTNIEMLTQASFGAKVLTYEDPNSQEKYDRSRVIFDIRE